MIFSRNTVSGSPWKIRFSIDPAHLEEINLPPNKDKDLGAKMASEEITLRLAPA
jgi:hypothetical protein